MVFNITPEEADYIVERRESIAEGWGTLPKGWTIDSLKKFWTSLTGKRVHKITKCMKKMEGKISDPGAFCASLARKIGYAPGSVDMTFKITAAEKKFILKRRKAISAKNYEKIDKFLLSAAVRLSKAVFRDRNSEDYMENMVDSLEKRLKPVVEKWAETVGVKNIKIEGDFGYEDASLSFKLGKKVNFSVTIDAQTGKGIVLIEVSVDSSKKIFKSTKSTDIFATAISWLEKRIVK